MRTSIRTFNVSKMVNEEVAIDREEILSIVEDKLNRTIVVAVGYYVGEELTMSNSFYIIGDNYDTLMSESPIFALGKPQNEYREVDLWYVIDLIASPSQAPTE